MRLLGGHLLDIGHFLRGSSNTRTNTVPQGGVLIRCMRLLFESERLLDHLWLLLCSWSVPLEYKDKKYCQVP